MGCGDSKSTSGQNPQQQQQPNKFDRLSEMDSQSTNTQTESSTKKALADKRARERAGQQDSQNTSNMKDTKNTRKGKKDQIREPINEKGFRRLVRKALREAATRSDIDELEMAMTKFENNKLEDHGDLEDAQERLHFLYLRREIRDATLRRHLATLDKAIANVESSQYRSELMRYLESAKKLRQHLVELNEFSHDVLEMEQETISEIKHYKHPPPGVKEVMTATYLILDYEESKLADWNDIQILLSRYGQESLLREVRNADTVNLDEHTCKRVEQLQRDFTLADIKRVSVGAATFYIWNQNMTKKYSKDKNRSAASNPPAANRKKNKG